MTTASIQLLFPMALYVLYMFVFALFMFRARLNAIRSGKVSVKYFRALTGEPPPDDVILMARHYDNQFQVPLLFLITGTLLIALHAASFFSVVLAWIFVASRAAHSLVQLGRNDVRKRVIAFAVGWIAVVVLWIQILLFALGAPAV